MTSALVRVWQATGKGITDSVYTYFESIDQPTEFGTFGEALVAQRKQLIICL